MSLRDTIEGARREAQQAGGVLSGKSDDEQQAEEAEATGFSRRSTARAKPARDAASSVRVLSAEDAKAGRSGKKASEMTKEERKAERNARRDADDRRSMVANILLKRDEAYSRTQRIWWIMLGSGFAITLLSFGINWALNHGYFAGQADLLVVVALVSIVLAYVLIIGAFVYDMVKARPIRKRVDEEVKGMTKKRLEQIIREDTLERDAKAKK